MSGIVTELAKKAKENTERIALTNMLTGETIAPDDANYDSYARANETFNKLGEHFDGTEYSPNDVLLYARENGLDWSNFNERYGGATGLKRHWGNPELVEKSMAAYRANQEAASQKAIADAKAEAEKDVTLDYGEGRRYTISTANANKIRELVAIADNAKAPEDLRKQAAQQLATLLGSEEIGYNLNGLDVSTIAKPSDLIDKLSAGEGGLSRYIDLMNILEEASRDRTPKVPEQKSLQDRMYERQERQLAIDRDKEARRLKMERLGTGIADLSASIGDMIRAHEGAPVSPRDWQRIYDSLTAQEKANINNYQVRMAKLNEDRRAERMAAAKAAADAREKALDRAEKAKDRNLKADEGQKDRDLKWAIANLRDKQNRYYAWLRWGQGGAGDKSKTHELLMIGDKAMLVRKGQSFTNTVNAIYDLLDKQGSYKNGKSDASIALLQGSPELNEEPQQFFNRTIQIVLSSHWDDLTDKAKREIIKKLQAMQGEWVTDAPSQKSNLPTSPGSMVGEVAEKEVSEEYDPNDPFSYFQ